METKKYQWREGGSYKNIDANDAVKELEKIQNIYGDITPEAIVKEAEKSDSLLHNVFQWDNEKAAHQYRLQQARMLINNIEIVVISDGEERTIPSYEIIKHDETKSYKNVKDFTASDVEQIKMQAIRELNTWKNKLTVYNQFSKATKKIEQAVDLLAK